MPYREPIAEIVDREPEAAAELRRRAKRVRLGSAAACLAGPILGAVPGYFFMQEAQFKVIGDIAWPAVSVVVGALLPILIGIRVTMALARWILRRKRDPWLDEVAARYAVPRKDLVKYTTSWQM